MCRCFTLHSPMLGLIDLGHDIGVSSVWVTCMHEWQFDQQGNPGAVVHYSSYPRHEAGRSQLESWTINDIPVTVGSQMLLYSDSNRT